MNNSAELEVLKLLYNYKNEDKITNLSEYPLTDHNFVNTISKSITDIIYNSYKNKSLNSKQTRETVLGLLRKWIEPSSHIPIDETNYDIFVKCLNKEILPLDTFYKKYGQDFIKFSTETSKDNKKVDWINICETANKKYITNLQNKIKSGLIQTWNKNQFDQTNFDYNGPNKSFQNPEIENFLEYLKSLKSKPEIIVHETIDECDTDIFETFKNFNTTISKEESNVQLGYALLNLEQNVHNEKLFLKVLENIYVSKTEAGLKFIDYTWTNKDNLKLPSKIYMKMLEYFKHLYEKPIIVLATEILEELNVGSKYYEYEILIENSNIKNVLEMCDLELSSNIIFIINKLLTLSRYDLRIFQMLNIVKTIFANSK